MKKEMPRSRKANEGAKRNGEKKSRAKRKTDAGVEVARPDRPRRPGDSSPDDARTTET